METLRPNAVLSRLKLLRCGSVGRTPQVKGRIWVRGEGRIVVGDRVILDGREAPVELHAHLHGELVLGDDVRVLGGSSIEATNSVVIGERSIVGPFSKIMDNQFHPLTGDRSKIPPPEPVLVEPDVRLAERTIVLPGAVVPRGSETKPGAVVRPRPRERGPSTGPAGETRTAGKAEGVPAPFAKDRILRRIGGLLRASLVLRRCDLGRHVYAFGKVRVENLGTISLGDRVFFLPGVLETKLVTRQGARLTVGHDTGFNYVSIEVHRSISIGRHCLFASGVTLCDGSAQSSSPIEIGDHVWLAHGVRVMPGVTIGSGSVVAAGTVVTRDVPEDSLAIGEPVRCMSLKLLSSVLSARGRAFASDPDQGSEPERSPNLPGLADGTGA